MTWSAELIISAETPPAPADQRRRQGRCGRPAPKSRSTRRRSAGSRRASRRWRRRATIRRVRPAASCRRPRAADRLQPVGAKASPVWLRRRQDRRRQPADIPRRAWCRPSCAAPANDPFQGSPQPSTSSPSRPSRATSLRTARKLQQPELFLGRRRPPRAARRARGRRWRRAAGRALPRATPLWPRFARPRGTKQLAAIIYADLGVPENAGKPITLIECLYRATSDRLCNDQGLLAAAAAAGPVPHAAGAEGDARCDRASGGRSIAAMRPGAADMLRLQSARLAAEAAISQAQAALIEAQYALALRIGTVADAAWPLASTRPPCGQLLVEAASRSPAASSNPGPSNA